MSRIVVTGMGIVSALGSDVAENWHSLQTLQSGIGKATHFQSAYASVFPFGEIQLSDEELKQDLYWNRERSVSRTTLIALKAFREAIAQAGLSEEIIQSPRTAFISASTVGGMCQTDALYMDANLTNGISPYINTYEGSQHLYEIVRMYGMRGYTDTINTACSSAANAILLGSRLLESGRADYVIAGGTDCLSKFTVNGFNSLRILSESPCKPFDEERDGLNLGEGAAYLVLEKADTNHSRKEMACLSGYGNSNDAFHPSATSDEAYGPVLAMSQALKKASLEPKAIDYVNAHGTGTPNNDLTESVALQTIFGDTPPPYSSTKAFTGHTLAAAGALEAVFSILALENDWLIPNIHLRTPIQAVPFSPVTESRKEPLKHVLSNSFGFGGNCTSLIFSKCIS